MTGAPGNAFFVNTAAKSGVGFSSAIRVSVILEGFGASAGVKSKRALPDAEAGGQLRLRGEPRAVRGAVREDHLRAGHGSRTVGEGPRSEADIFRGAPQIVVEMAAPLL